MNKERLWNIGLIALACLVSFGLGHYSFASGVEEANRHAEELARIEAHGERASVFWPLVGMGIVFVLGAVAFAVVMKYLAITEVYRKRNGLPVGDEDSEDVPSRPYSS